MARKPRAAIVETPEGLDVQPLQISTVTLTPEEIAALTNPTPGGVVDPGPVRYVPAPRTARRERLNELREILAAAHAECGNPLANADVTIARAIALLDDITGAA